MNDPESKVCILSFRDVHLVPAAERDAADEQTRCLLLYFSCYFTELCSCTPACVQIFTLTGAVDHEPLQSGPSTNGAVFWVKPESAILHAAFRCLVPNLFSCATQVHVCSLHF